MNSLKLLTRSTNLDKHHANHERIPSSSDIPRNQSTGSVDQKKVLNAPRGVKRKRDGTSQNEDQKTTTLRTAQGSKEVPSSGKEVVTASNSQEAQSTKEDDKRLLKKNRIKISILNASATSHSDPSRRSKTNVPSEKVKRAGYQQVYPHPLSTFEQLRSEYDISPRLYDNLMAQGYHEPTEVQMGSLPVLLGSDKQTGLTSEEETTAASSHSQVDLLTAAPTGSGKTIAFLLPTLQSLLDERKKAIHEMMGHSERDQHVRAIVLAPTHELVGQIVNEGKKLAQGTGIRISALRKGVRLHDHLVKGSSEDQRSDSEDPNQHASKVETLLKSDIVVSTPPMLAWAISNRDSLTTSPLPSVRHLILDEADALLDEMFHEKTMSIWNACDDPLLRTSLWSATINSSVESFTQKFMLDRRKRLLKESSQTAHYVLRLVVGLKDSSLPNISHRLVYAATERGKLLALRQLLTPAAASMDGVSALQPPFLIFTQTIPRAIALHSELLYDIPPEAGGSSRIAVLHSDLSETARSNVMKGVRKGEIWILITTDLLSRGVDLKGMNGVVSYDIPSTSASYVHRAGRTGRQGREGGVAVTLYTKEDIPYVKNIANVIAASEKARATGDSRSLHAHEKGMQQWLLDSLPDVSKKLKKDLKQKGIDYRREHSTDPRKAKKMRISTKSGYDRRMEDRLKSMKAARSKQKVRKSSHDDGEDGVDWEGFD